jgi:DNA-binding XRE family transcriptional regulator
MRKLILRSQGFLSISILSHARISLVQRYMLDKQPEVSPLKWMRNRVGLTQKALADRIGVDWRTISAWETGRRDPELRIWQFKALCDALQIDYKDLPDSFAPQRLPNGQTEG